MDELSPEAEAKDMELVATRGEEEQGSGRRFRRPWAETKQSGLCDDEFRLRAEFLFVQTKRNQKLQEGKSGPFRRRVPAGPLCLSGPAPTGGVLSLTQEKVPKECAGGWARMAVGPKDGPRPKRLHPRTKWDS